MQKMLQPIVLRLKELQKPILYRFSDGSYEVLRVYLIGISNDKPANSLVQNQAEPNAMYGCSKCEIAGNPVSDSQKLSIESLFFQAIPHQRDFRRNQISRRRLPPRTFEFFRHPSTVSHCFDRMPVGVRFLMRSGMVSASSPMTKSSILSATWEIVS